MGLEPERVNPQSENEKFLCRIQKRNKSHVDPSDRAETNNRILGIVVPYPTIRISGTVYQIFIDSPLY